MRETEASSSDPSQSLEPAPCRGELERNSPPKDHFELRLLSAVIEWASSLPEEACDAKDSAPCSSWLLAPILKTAPRVPIPKPLPTTSAPWATPSNTVIEGKAAPLGIVEQEFAVTATLDFTDEIAGSR